MYETCKNWDNRKKYKGHMSNVILGNNFYFGSPFFGAAWNISSMGKKQEKEMVKFTSQINLKLTLVTMRNVFSSTIFAINLTCKWTWPILFNWTCWSNIFWHSTKSCSLLLSLNLTSLKSQCAFWITRKEWIKVLYAFHNMNLRQNSHR